jgi:hypothetical protein
MGFHRGRSLAPLPPCRRPAGLRRMSLCPTVVARAVRDPASPLDVAELTKVSLAEFGQPACVVDELGDAEGERGAHWASTPSFTRSMQRRRGRVAGALVAAGRRAARLEPLRSRRSPGLRSRARAARTQRRRGRARRPPGRRGAARPAAAIAPVLLGTQRRRSRAPRAARAVVIAHRAARYMMVAHAAAVALAPLVTEGATSGHLRSGPLVLYNHRECGGSLQVSHY